MENENELGWVNLKSTNVLWIQHWHTLLCMYLTDAVWTLIMWHYFLHDITWKCDFKSKIRFYQLMRI